jgi:hypothetical protein
MTLAQTASSIQFSTDTTCLRFQLALMKINSTPFGIPIKGMKTPISNGLIFQITSVIVSVYLFVLGIGTTARR